MSLTENRQEGLVEGGVQGGYQSAQGRGTLW